MANKRPKPDMNALCPRAGDTRIERIKKHLMRAREYLPANDAFLVKRAQQIRDKDAKKAGIDPPDKLITIHLSGSGKQWSFYEFVEINELELAWDELEWAFQRYAAMIRIGGGNMPCFKDFPDPHDIGASKSAFWHSMAMAAREMMHDEKEPHEKIPDYKKK
jgi:hypothetical protein